MTPQINESDMVRLSVEQTVEDILPSSAQGPLAALAGPSTSTRSVKTTVIAQDNQTIVIGGLIQDRFTTQLRKVPLLGDIPILGYLFKSKTKTKVKSNLLVFLTPHIIREPSDFLTILKRKIDQRNNFLEQNFSKKDRKQVRQAIRIHAENLLEYQEPIQPPTDYSSSGIRELEPGAVPPPGSAPLPSPSVIDLEDLDEDVDVAPESDPEYQRSKKPQQPNWESYSTDSSLPVGESPKKAKKSKKPGSYKSPPPPEEPSLPREKSSDEFLTEEDMDLAL